MIISLFVMVTPLLLVLIWLERRKRRYKVFMESFKFGFKSLPILGLSHHFITDNEGRLKSLQMMGMEAVKAGGAGAGWLVHLPYLVIADPELGDYALKTCLDKDDIMKILKCVVGDGLIIAPLSVWRHRRKILMPTFTTKNIREFVAVFNKQANIMVDQLESRIGGEPFPIWKYLASNNMDTVGETVFGLEIHSQTDPNNLFLQAMAEVASIMASRLSQPWLHSDTIFKLFPLYQRFKKSLQGIYDIVDKVMETKHKEIEDATNGHKKTQNSNFKPFLELLLESSVLENGIAKGGYNDRELREETMTLTIAGTDTSAAGLAFAVHCLSRHQDVQEKVYKEIVDVFGESDQAVQLEGLKKLDYMDAVIKEAMRLYPPVPVFMRRVSEDITLPSGVVVPEGCNVMMNAWALHRNPKYWGDDAEEFRPERFLKPLKHPAQYMAFGYGPRNCPGQRYAMMSMKTVLTTLLRRCKVLPSKDGDSLRLSFEVFLKDANGYVVRLDKRVKKIYE